MDLPRQSKTKVQIHQLNLWKRDSNLKILGKTTIKLLRQILHQESTDSKRGILMLQDRVTTPQ